MKAESLNNFKGYKQNPISFAEYFYIFILIVYAGQASTLVRAVSFSDNFIGYSIPILLSIFFAIKWRITVTKQFLKLIFFLFLYFIAITIKYREIHPSIFFYYLLIFFFVYVNIFRLQFDFFLAYKTILFYLAIVGIAMWLLQTALGGDTLYNLISKIPGIEKFSFVSGEGGVNVIFYTVQPTATSLLYGIPIPRNCGFAWEPGGFAIYLCLAIFIQMFLTQGAEKFNVTFWGFLFALLTTQSTTGYSIFITLLFFYYINRKSLSVVLIFPVFIIAVIFTFTLPFMSKKIKTFVDETNDIDYIVWRSIGNESGTDPQRFTSFLISFRDFKENPVLGTAGITGTSWYSKIGANISPISGIGNLMANFGSAGLLFFLLITYKTSIMLSKVYEYRGKSLFFIVTLLISISYSVIFLPLIISFWIFSFLNPIEQKDIIKNEERGENDQRIKNENSYYIR